MKNDAHPAGMPAACFPDPDAPPIRPSRTILDTLADVARMKAERDEALALLRRFMSEPVGYRRDKDSAYDDTRKFLEGLK